MGKKEKKRIEWIDIMKGIAMMMVISGHVFAPFGLRYVIYSCHIPIFFIISGYFLKTDGSFTVFFKTLAKSYIVPYIITAVIILVVNLIQSDAIGMSTVYEWLVKAFWGIPNTKDTILYWGISQIGPIWFLQALFVSELYVFILNRYIKKYKIRIVVFAVSAFVCVIASNYIWLPCNILNGVFNSIFVYSGGIIKKKQKIFEDRIRAFSSRLLLMAGSISVLVILGTMLHRQKCNFATLRFPLNGIEVLGAFSGFALCAGLALFIWRHVLWASNVLQLIGVNSLYIMCIHTIDYENINWKAILFGQFEGVLTALICLILRFLVPVIIGICFGSLLVFIKERKRNE